MEDMQQQSAGDKDIFISYNILIDKIKDHQLPDKNTLIDIKRKFSSEIGSPRRLRHISTLPDLIYELERRELITHLNIKLIEKILDCTVIDIRHLIIKHHKLLIGFNYQSGPIVSKSDRLSEEHFNSDHEIPASVSEVICESIGDDWYELASILKISIAEITAIDSDFDNDSEKSKEVLKRFKASNLSLKRCQLLDALSLLRRNNLRNKVEKLLMSACTSCRSPFV